MLKNVIVVNIVKEQERKGNMSGLPLHPSLCRLPSGMLDRVLQYDHIEKVQFVLTFYWFDSGPKNGTEDYGYNRFNTTEVLYWCYNRQGNTCTELTQSEIDEFESKFGDCLAYAASNGLDIGVNARVDDGRKQGGWRNSLNFDPTKNYSMWSYETAFLDPIADAIIASTEPGTEVDFTLQGEMGATAFMHPKEWIDVIDRIRNKIRIGRLQNDVNGKTQIGMGMNNNKACGCIGLEIVNGYKYLKFLKTAFDPTIYPQGLEAIKDAYMAADFISISAYVPMPNPNFTTCDL